MLEVRLNVISNTKHKQTQKRSVILKKDFECDEVWQSNPSQFGTRNYKWKYGRLSAQRSLSQFPAEC
jgi:hypothetical protein